MNKMPGGEKLYEPSRVVWLNTLAELRAYVRDELYEDDWQTADAESWASDQVYVRRRSKGNESCYLSGLNEIALVPAPVMEAFKQNALEVGRENNGRFQADLMQMKEMAEATAYRFSVEAALDYLAQKVKKYQEDLERGRYTSRVWRYRDLRKQKGK